MPVTGVRGGRRLRREMWLSREARVDLTGTAVHGPHSARGGADSFPNRPEDPSGCSPHILKAGGLALSRFSPLPLRWGALPSQGGGVLHASRTPAPRLVPETLAADHAVGPASARPRRGPGLAGSGPAKAFYSRPVSSPCPLSSLASVAALTAAVDPGRLSASPSRAAPWDPGNKTCR